MGNFDGYKSIYGAFAAVPFFLLWLNLLWTLVLGGAVLTSSLSYWRGEAFRRSLDARGRFDDVLKILLLLDSAQQNGKALPVQEFRRHINMGFDELGELLEKLARHGYVYSGRQGWVLKMGRSPSTWQSCSNSSSTVRKRLIKTRSIKRLTTLCSPAWKP